jgi:hypothetical protein
MESGKNKDTRLMLRTYELLDFIKKFMRRVEQAINSLGPKFIQKFCIEKMRGDHKTPTQALAQIKTYKKLTALQSAKLFQQIHCPEQTPKKNLYLTPNSTQSNFHDTNRNHEEDCNLDEPEEEKQQVCTKTHKKAMLSIDKIISTIKDN